MSHHRGVADAVVVVGDSNDGNGNDDGNDEIEINFAPMVDPIQRNTTKNHHDDAKRSMGKGKMKKEEEKEEDYKKDQEDEEEDEEDEEVEEEDSSEVIISSKDKTISSKDKKDSDVPKQKRGSVFWMFATGGITGCIIIIALLVTLIVVLLIKKQTDHQTIEETSVLLTANTSNEDKKNIPSPFPFLVKEEKGGLISSPSFSYTPTPSSFSMSPLPTLVENALSAVAIDASISPSPFSSTSPTPTATAMIPCTPTSGSCLETTDALVEALATAQSFHTVEICPNSLFVLDQPIFISQPNITICSQTLSIVGSPNGQVLSIYADGVTLRGIFFLNIQGTTPISQQPPPFGGLVTIRAFGPPGSEVGHTIESCWFYGGTSNQEGGNLMVSAQTALIVRNSTFVGGSALLGGALAVLGPLAVQIEGCYFQNNRASPGANGEAGGDGGAIYITKYPTSQGFDAHISIVNTTFEGNNAILGGAITATELGMSPSISLQMNTFVNNQAKETAAAAAIFLREDNIQNVNLLLDGNKGHNNEAPTCSAFYVFLSNKSNQPCFVLNRFYSPTSPTYSPVPSEAPPVSSFSPIRPTLASIGPTLPPGPIPWLPCTSSLDSCASNEEDLGAALRIARSGDTVQICSFHTILLAEPVFIWRNDVTLCCQQACSLTSQGNSILQIFGNNVTLRGIDFIGVDNLNTVTRQLPVPEYGGLVSFWTENYLEPGVGGGGVHVIDSCLFENGSAFLQGGNLYVETAQSELLIRNSTFLRGFAQDGGGIAIIDAPRIQIENCLFQENHASSNGGAFYTTIHQQYVSGQDITVLQTTFENNRAVYGGAILATAIGEMPSLELRMNTFLLNQAESDGGIAAIFYYGAMENIEVQLWGNTGGYNAAGNCQGFYLFLDRRDVCFAPDEYYTPAPTMMAISTGPISSRPISLSLSPVYPFPNTPSPAPSFLRPPIVLGPVYSLPYTPSPAPSFFTQGRVEAARIFLTDIGYEPYTSAAVDALYWIAIVDEQELRVPSLGDSNTGPFVQRYALAVLYFALGGSEWKYQSNFLSSFPTCDWRNTALHIPSGVTCNRFQQVTSVFLADNNHGGQIPNEIGLLTTLEKIDFSFGQLTGTIPRTMYYLSSLVDLHLEYNTLVGPISSDIEAFTDLRNLRLSNNFLSGTLPSQMTNLHLLTYLAVDDNMFTGIFYFLRESFIQYLLLDHNNFSGPFPLFGPDDTINLIQFDISHNEVSGTIPEALFFQPYLESIDLSFNRIHGTIPELIGYNSVLKVLSAAENQIEGRLPESMRYLSRLVHLDLSSNSISGTIPSSLGQFYELEYLFLGDNPFTPYTLPSFSTPKLTELSLAGTNLVGTIPETLEELRKLQLLDFSNNMLTGTLPASLGSLSDLRFILLNRNQLQGTISPEFDGKNLNVGLFDHNRFTGTLPLCNNPIEMLSGDCDLVDCPCCHICCTSSNRDYWQCNDDIKVAAANIGWENNFRRSEFVFGPNLVVPGDPVFTLPPIFPTKFPSPSMDNGSQASPAPTSSPQSVTLSPQGAEIDFLYLLLSQTWVGGQTSDVSAKAAEWIIEKDMLSDSVPQTARSPEAASFLQRYGFAALLISLRGTEWFNSYEPVFSSIHECSWTNFLLEEAITTLCRDGEEIIGFSIDRLAGHEGFIPAEVGLLSSLTSLFLSGTNVTGTLPSQLFRVSTLEVLVLDNNGIIGWLPDDIRGLSNLRTLSLSHNKFEGTLPRNLVRGYQLDYLAVDLNFFTGTVDFLNELSTMKFLYLNDNLLGGVLEFFDPSQMESLVELDISGNDITGAITSSIVNHPTVMRIDIGGNRLAGTLPEFQANGVLELLSISGGQIYGTIPSSISNLQMLTHLDISDNQFSGSLPADSISLLTSLGALFMGENPSFTFGPIPDSLSYLYGLSALSLRNTQRIGTIPLWLPKLTYLKYLDLSSNQLVGEIPQSLTTLDLEYLLLQRNPIEGEFPNDFDRPMSVVMLDHTNLTGPIPCFWDSIDILVADSDVVQCPCCNVCCLRFGPADEYELCNNDRVTINSPDLKNHLYFVNFTSSGRSPFC